ncbi:hypothetical protein K438DRAFT_1786082 [Mycena galopus ATCC 62051]|nr:hypothetical protein K438DRAFT_1786082 [Mycena galopus ATCC 62051]
MPTTPSAAAFASRWPLQTKHVGGRAAFPNAELQRLVKICSDGQVPRRPRCTRWIRNQLRNANLPKKYVRKTWRRAKFVTGRYTSPAGDGVGEAMGSRMTAPKDARIRNAGVGTESKISQGKVPYV